MWGSSASYKRFRNSMNIGYEQWHDGIGYDLEALDQLEGKERDSVERDLIARLTSDWRDLEALDRLQTPRATQAILDARNAAKPEIRMYAHRYGPEPTEAEWETAILYGLQEAKSFTDGLLLVFNAAIAHPTPAVREALWRYVRIPRPEGSYHAGEALCRIAGVLEEFDMETHRPLLLRLGGFASDQRDQALRELEQLCAGVV